MQSSKTREASHAGSWYVEDSNTIPSLQLIRAQKRNSTINSIPG